VSRDFRPNWWREARCRVFEALGKGEALRQEAAAIDASLRSGRWILLRSAWEFHLEEAQRWLAAEPLEAPKKNDKNVIALSNAAEWIYREWRTRPESKGRRILDLEGRPVLISWVATPEKLAAVLSGPDNLGLMWKQALEGQRVRAALVDADGQVVIGAFDKAATWQTLRAAVATGLPWTLQVTSADPGAELAGFAARRNLLLFGLAMVAMALLAGLYFILRAMNRELAVGKLQSEFVATVSHEFRSPLTSMRQLSEMLSKGRVPTEDLRQQSYEILARESERLQRLVESLLDFGRFEGGAARYNFRGGRSARAAFLSGRRLSGQGGRAALPGGMVPGRSVSGDPR
jgi:signal transduction histidine kinase